MAQTQQKTECSFIPTVINKYTARVYTWRNRVPQGALERLELLDAKVSRAVLRGRVGGNTALLLDTLAITSEGEMFENQRHYRRNLGRIKGLSKGFSRKCKGSRNWWKNSAKLARTHDRVASQRADSLHKMTTYLARTYCLIGLEDLNAKGMLQNHHLAQAVSDASFFEVRRQLLYKSEQHGGSVQLVDRWFASSKICHQCRWVKEDLTLADREWDCEHCDTHILRDKNASLNIKEEAIRLVTGVPVVASSAREFACGVECSGSLITTRETFCSESGTETSSDVA